MISPEKIAEMLAAAEKATPGEWRRATGTTNYRIYGKFREVASAFQVRHHSKAGDLLVEADGRANADHIALCDHATITEILSELLTLRAERDEAREALKPFAKIADEIQEVLHDDRKPGLWATPTAGDFRRARSALEDFQQ